MCALFSLIIILGILCLFLCWLLVAPIELEINTETPVAAFRWVSIGSVRVWYDEEWWISIRVFFFYKTLPFAKMKKRPAKATRSATNGNQQQKRKPHDPLNKILQVAGTLQVAEWQLAIDLGRFDMNARLYPLNFLSFTSGHLFINFQGYNLLKVKLRGQAWKIVYVFLK